MPKNWKTIIGENLDNVRLKHPLVHNITNFVVMNSSANILLAQGAQPVMAHAHNEVEDMVGIANSLVLNIGTLTDEWVESMILAGKRANELGIPVIFDPVGAGATNLRTRKSEEIMSSIDISVLRGNASEINAIAGAAGARGVDSVHSIDDVMANAPKIAKAHNCIVAISGERDLIADGDRIVRVANGNQIMTLVTGLGCGLSATVAAFIGANDDAFEATVSAFGFYNIAGEVAFEKTRYPGSFEAAFIDALNYLGNKELSSLHIVES